MSEQRDKRVEVIGGDEYEVGSMAHAAAVKRRDGEVEDLKKVIEKLEEDLEEAKARADEEKARADEEKKKLDEEKKRLEERLDELEKKFDEMVEERAKERADLLQTAKDENVDIREDASDHEIRCKLLERLTPGVRFDSKDAAKDGERARIALELKLEERRAAREKSGVASVAEAVLDKVIGVVDRLIEGIDDLAQEMADTRGAVAGLDESPAWATRWRTLVQRPERRLWRRTRSEMQRCRLPLQASGLSWRVCTLPDVDHPMAEAWVYENAID